MIQYIDKSAVVAEIESLLDKGRYHEEYDCAYRDGNNGALYALKDKLDNLEVKEVNEEPAETYMQIFEKKFPILPTLKGKQLSKFKNFLNKCQQTFGLQEFGIYPVQAKLFEKLTLLWAVWGAENLQRIGKIEGEFDVVKEVDLEKEINKYISDNFFGSQTLGFFANRTKEEPNDEDIALVAKYFFELGLKAQKGK